jgi:hypothetical protein
LGTLYAVRGLVRFRRRDSKSTVLRPERYTKGPGHPKGYPGQFIVPLGGLPGVAEASTISAWERSNWRGQALAPLRERLRRTYRGHGGVGCLEDEWARAGPNPEKRARGTGVSAPLHPRRSLGHTDHPTPGYGEREVRAGLVDRQARARVWPGATQRFSSRGLACLRWNRKTRRT